MDQTQCLVINMDGHEGRFERVKAELAKANVPNVTRLSAVVGKNIPFSKRLGHFENPILGAIFPRSSLGCALSHKMAWKRAAESDSPWTLILEDDVRWCKGVNVDTAWRDIRNLVSEAGSFDVLLLGYYGGADPSDPDARDPLEFLINLVAPPKDCGHEKGRLFRPQRFVGAHAYIVSRDGARKMLKTHPHVSGHVDLEMSNMNYHDEVRMLAVRPAMLHQDHSGSSQASASPYVLTPIMESIWPTTEKIQPLDFGVRFPIIEVGSQKVEAWQIPVGMAAYAGGLLSDNTSLALLVGTLVVAALLLADSLVFTGTPGPFGSLGGTASAFFTAAIFGGACAALGSLTRCGLDWCIDCTRCWNRK